MRYENPLYFAEDAGAADLIAGGRLQLGISRGSPEQVIDGWRYFGYAPADGDSDADMARRHTEVALEVLEGNGFAEPNPRPMFANPPGLLRIEPHSAGLRERIWWGSGSNATSVWAARLGLNLQSSTLKDDETGEPLHVQQRKQIEAYREAWNEAGHDRQPRVSVSRSIFALTTDTDRAYFGGDRDSQDQIGMIDENTRAIFGRSYAAEPDVLVERAPRRRGDPGRGHAAADRAQPARRRIQRSRDREHPHPRRAGARLALAREIESLFSAARSGGDPWVVENKPGVVELDVGHEVASREADTAVPERFVSLARLADLERGHIDPTHHVFTCTALLQKLIANHRQRVEQRRPAQVEEIGVIQRQLNRPLADQLQRELLGLKPVAQLVRIA